MEASKLVAALRKRGIVVHPDDPILDVGAIYELAITEQGRAQLEAIDAAWKEAGTRMAMASAAGLDGAKLAAGQVVTEAAEWVTEQLRGAAAEITATLLHAVSVEVAAAQAARRSAVRAAWLAGALLFGTAGISAGALLASGWHAP